MLISYPSFIGEKEQSKSDLLFNNIKILIQTHIGEIWLDTEYGTTIRNYIKKGIDELVISAIQDEIETKLTKYFSNQIVISNLETKQENDKLLINLTYIELQTGKYYTVKAEEILPNSDTTLY